MEYLTNEPAVEERFVGVAEVAEDVHAATCIGVDTVVVVAIVNGSVVVGGTSVRPPRGSWDQNGGVVDGTRTVGNRNIEASHLVPLADQEGEDRAYTCKTDYTPLVGDRCTEVDHTTPAEVRRVTRTKTTGRQLESFWNFLRY